MAIAIRAEHLSKEYRLGVINHGMLYKDMQSWMARKLGKPDPHARIGNEHFVDQEDRFWALKDLSFCIEQGDRVGIIGRNGAGKSTLLKILSRITAPTEGTIRIKGRVASLLEVGTGFHPELTGRENIFLNGAILGMKKKEIIKKMDEIVEFAELEKFIDTPVKRYSSGMYVRLAFSVAAHLDSDILLADEVLAVGDAAFQDKCLSKMNDISKKEGKTVLFVSHNMASIGRLCHSGILLKKGRMEYCSSIIDDVITRYFENDQGKGLENKWSFEDLKFLPEFCLKSIALMNSRHEIHDDSLDNESDIVIQVSFNIAEKNPRLFYGLRFYANNTLVFNTSPFDSISDYTPVIGDNVIYCRIPKKFLNKKNYRIECEASIFGERWLLEPGVSAPSISLTIDKYLSCSPFVDAGRDGNIAPFLPWSLE